jgi:tripartite-type tricarboxylate transporter receptor subunit TctC
MAPALKNIIGQNVVAVNKPAAGMSIGFSVGAKDKPSGYRVTALVSELLAVPHVTDVDFTYGTLSVTVDAP